MNDETRFRIREIYNKYRIVVSYFLREPYYELKRIINGYYNSILLFWLSIMTYIWLWQRGIGGLLLKIAGFLILITFFYMFMRSNKWKEYYHKEYMEGKEIE